MVSHTEVVIALGMPDTVHYRSHVDGDHTSKYQELIGEVREYFSLLSDWKNSGLGRDAIDDDDKDVEILEECVAIRRNKDGQWRPTPHCPRRHSLQNFCCTAYHRRENVYSARHTFHSSLHLPRLQDNGSFPRSCTKYTGKHSNLLDDSIKDLCAALSAQHFPLEVSGSKHHE